MINSEERNPEMAVNLNPNVLAELGTIVQTEQPEDLHEVEVANGSMTLGITRNPSDIIVFDQIEHDGVTYYVGLPKH